VKHADVPHLAPGRAQPQAAHRHLYQVGRARGSLSERLMRENLICGMVGADAAGAG